MYNRNADFEELCDRIDAHVFTGDTLTDPEMRTLLTSYVKRWVPQIKSWNEIQAESSIDPSDTVTSGTPVRNPEDNEDGTKIKSTNAPSYKKDIVSFEDDHIMVVNGVKYDKRVMSLGEVHMTKDRVCYDYDTRQTFYVGEKRAT